MRPLTELDTIDRTCPTSQIEYRGACPVRGCVYNDSGNCLYTRLAAIPADNVEARLRLIARAHPTADAPGQFQHLRALARARAAERSLDRQLESCRACGYPRPCKSTTLCEERREALDAVRLRHRDLLPHEVWYAVINGTHGFMRDEDVQALTALVSQSDRVKGR